MIQDFLSPRFLLVLAVGLVLALAALTPVQAQATQPDPTNVEVFAGNGYLALRWNAPDSWASTAARGFEVNFCACPTAPAGDSSDWKELATPSETDTRSLLTGTVQQVTVTNGTKYHLRIRAKSGTSPSDVASSWVVASGTPSLNSFTVSPRTVEVFKGGRVGYTIRLNSRPSSNVTVTPVSGNSDKATVGSALVFSPDDWWGDKTVIITGVDTGTTAISHTITSDDSSFESSGAEQVDVTVAATPSKPTITILNKEFNYREGSTAPRDSFPADFLRFGIPFRSVIQPPAFGSHSVPYGLTGE